MVTVSVGLAAEPERQAIPSPIFQDRQLASFAPRLLGGWAVAELHCYGFDQTLQVYDRERRAELWRSPILRASRQPGARPADAFLTGIQTAEGEVHLNIHDMTTGQENRPEQCGQRESTTRRPGRQTANGSP